ncbi:MAG TPA: iron-sulfur cluster repair di-iron protein [bacterium]|nr:iron-sulfur cluster repair di-iron protein [bacterium]
MKTGISRFEATRTVGVIASEFEPSIPVFEGFKIDYCCGGNRTLSEACNLAGIPVEKVVSALKKVEEDRAFAAGASMDWKGKSAAELIDHILTKHHVYTRSQLARLKALSEKVLNVHGNNHPELSRLSEIVHEMAEEMEGHMAKEEEQVFPYLQAVEKAGWNKEGIADPFGGGPLDTHPLKILMWEHGMTGEEFVELHQLTQDFTPPPDACRSYQALYGGLRELEADLHRHVHLENNVLFEKAMEKGILD